MPITTTVTNGTNKPSQGTVSLSPGQTSSPIVGTQNIETAAKAPDRDLTGSISAEVQNGGSQSVKVDGGANGPVTISPGNSATIVGPADNKDAKLALRFHVG